jgi:hypothetical protein
MNGTVNLKFEEKLCIVSRIIKTGIQALLFLKSRSVYNSFNLQHLLPLKRITRGYGATTVLSAHARHPWSPVLRAALSRSQSQITEELRKYEAKAKK